MLSAATARTFARTSGFLATHAGMQSAYLPKAGVLQRLQRPVHEANAHSSPRFPPLPFFSQWLKFPQTVDHPRPQRVRQQVNVGCLHIGGGVYQRSTRITIMGYYCNDDGFNLGLRMAWSVRAGRPAYSVSQGRRAHLARRRVASSETTSLRLFLCEVLGILRL